MVEEELRVKPERVHWVEQIAEDGQRVVKVRVVALQAVVDDVGRRKLVAERNDVVASIVVAVTVVSEPESIDHLASVELVDRRFEPVDLAHRHNTPGHLEPSLVDHFADWP